MQLKHPMLASLQTLDSECTGLPAQPDGVA
jgi:hypothetical protein